MKAAFLFGAWFLFSLLIGLVGGELGLTQTPTNLISPPTSPGGGGFLDNILAPLVYVWTAANGFIQIMTFQAQGIPPIVVAFVFWPMQVTFVFLFLKLVRG